MRIVNLRPTSIRTGSLASSKAVGALMNNLRTWLDHQGIEPVDFVPIRLTNGHLAFDLRFGSEQQATLFKEVFGAGWKDASSDLPQLAA